MGKRVASPSLNRQYLSAFLSPASLFPSCSYRRSCCTFKNTDPNSANKARLSRRHEDVAGTVDQGKDRLRRLRLSVSSDEG